MQSPISRAIPLTQLAEAAASITGSYTSIGAFSSPVEIMHIVSTLDAAVQLSFDGVHDHIAVPAGSAEPVFLPINFKTNCMVLPGTGISIKQIGTPTTGNLYISAFSAVLP